MSLQLISLCTGNAARSVMFGALLESRRPDITVVTAGTHVIDGQPISRRTRAGLAAIGLDADTHRSRQLDPDDLASTTLVVAMAHEHVLWMRRNHPGAAERTGVIRLLATDLGSGPAPLEHRLAALDLASRATDPAIDVLDPAGGEAADYIRCAQELEELTDLLVGKL